MTAIFLDLDGTLMDSQRGIESSLRHAFRGAGYHELAESDLKWMLGPPFLDSFAKLGITETAGILTAYRDVYTAGGMYDAAVYDGIFPMLDGLRDAGHRLFLMTAKPHSYARQITAHFELAPYFEAEYGPETDGTRGHKADLLAHALNETGIDPGLALMVGDRAHDIEAATANRMTSVAVRWGYGNAAEWADAHHLVQHPTEVVTLAASLLQTERTTP